MSGGPTNSPTDGTQGPETDPHIVHHQIYNKGDTAVQWGKDGISINDLGELGFCMEENEPSLILHTMHKN